MDLLDKIIKEAEYFHNETGSKAKFVYLTENEMNELKNEINSIMGISRGNIASLEGGTVYGLEIVKCQSGGIHLSN